MAVTTARVSRVFEGSLEQLEPLRLFVNETTIAYGGGEHDLFALELACDEAAANVFRHTFNGAPGRLTLEMWREEAPPQVVVRMTYPGPAFDLSTVPDPDLKAPLEERRAGGLGIYFMRKVMSQVRFDHDPQRGNILTMSRVLGSQAPTHH